MAGPTGKAAGSGGREPCALPPPPPRSLATGEWPSSLPPLQVPVRLSAFSRAASHPDLVTDLAHPHEDLAAGGVPSIYVNSLCVSHVPLGFLLHLRWDFTIRAHSELFIVNFRAPE